LKIKTSDADVWYWHELMEAFVLSGMKPKAYCDRHKIKYKDFTNKRYRILYKVKSNPKQYAIDTIIARKYMSSGQPAREFAKDNGIDFRILGQLVTHLGYLDIIERLKKEKHQPEETMNFIQVPSFQKIQPVEQEALEKKNDIELTISSGVKVIVSPEVSSEKLIKIIEFLKDL